jgi:hypothetical protein
MSDTTRPTPEALVEDAWAQAVAVSQNLARPLDAFVRLSDVADSNYHDFTEASDQAVHALRPGDYLDGTGAPNWGEAIGYLARAEGCLHTISELRGPIIRAWDEVRQHLADYAPDLNLSSAAGGHRGMYAWLAFQTTLMARPDEVAAMTVAERVARFGALGDELIDRMHEASSGDREANDWWNLNIDGRSDPDREPILRTDREIEGDVLHNSLPNQYRDEGLPSSALDRYLAARDLANYAANLPSGNAVTRGASPERDMITTMLRLAADHPDETDSEAHHRLAEELNELAVDLGRRQWYTEYNSDDAHARGVVTNLRTATERIREIAAEAAEPNRQRALPRPEPERDITTRTVPARLPRDTAGLGE